MTFNLFGATAAHVIRNFQVGGYTPTLDDFGGEAVVLDVMQGMEGTLLDAMPPRMFQTLATPDLLRAVTRATAGQTTFTLPAIFRPLVAGSLHLWRGWPAGFLDRPMRRTDPNFADAYMSNNGQGSGSIRYAPRIELDAGAFTYDTATGVVTLAEALEADWAVYASFSVDVASEDYAVESLAKILESGAAGEIGSRIYSRATDQWALVDGFVQAFAAAVAAIGAGERIPPEIRVLSWWQEVEKAQANRLGSVRMFRG
jgi:hypothetical protein